MQQQPEREANRVASDLQDIKPKRRRDQKQGRIARRAAADPKMMHHFSGKRAVQDTKAKGNQQGAQE